MTKSGRGRVSDPTIRLDGWSQCMDQLSVCRRQRCRHASPHPGNGGAIADELIEWRGASLSQMEPWSGALLCLVLRLWSWSWWRAGRRPVSQADSAGNRGHPRLRDKEQGRCGRRRTAMLVQAGRRPVHGLTWHRRRCSHGRLLSDRRGDLGHSTQRELQKLARRTWQWTDRQGPRNAACLDRLSRHDLRLLWRQDPRLDVLHDAFSVRYAGDGAASDVAQFLQRALIDRVIDRVYWSAFTVAIRGEPDMVRTCHQCLRLNHSWNAMHDAWHFRSIETVAYLLSTRVRASALRRSGPGSCAVRQRLCYLPPVDCLSWLPNWTTCMRWLSPGERPDL